MSAIAGPDSPATSPAARHWTRLRALAKESWKYLAASLVALAVDYCLLVLLTEVAHLHYLLSAAIGFTAGLVVTYVLSVSLIFKERRYGRGVELSGFVVIGLVGLGLNEVLLKVMVEGLGVYYAWAKIPAAGISFLFNFVARRLILFTAAPPREPAAPDG